MKDFRVMTWGDVRLLSIPGKVGPHSGLSSALILAGIKPVWLTPQDVADQFVYHFGKQGFIAEVIPKLMSRPNFWDSKYGVFHERNRASFEALCKAFDLIEGEFEPRTPSKDTLDQDIALGRALGYSESDIARFIIHNLSEEEFKAWKTQ